MNLSFVFAYYNNVDDLAQQLAVWTSYPRDIRRQIKMIVVDDGSPTPLCVDNPVPINLSVYRLTQDVGFNLGGARNVGAHVAPDGWLFLADIDYVVSADACRQMLALPYDEGVYYNVERTVNGRPHFDPPNAFIIQRNDFWKVGGYDEDLAGEYGGEDILLRKLMARYLQERDSKVVVAQFGNTRYTLPATEPNRSNLQRNNRKVQAKLADPNYRPERPLRVPWVSVSSYRLVEPTDRSAPMNGFHEAAVTPYVEACRLAVVGDYATARDRFIELDCDAVPEATRALAVSNLGVLSAASGLPEESGQHFRRALTIDERCEAARTNLNLLGEVGAENGDVSRRASLQQQAADRTACDPPIKVALLSFLFNWPSTGGGIIHTIELAKFLSRAGYEVQHYYPRNEAWGVGRVEELLEHRQVPLEFDDASWNLADIQRRFREEVGRFDPDCAIITDSWNMKPLLAEAVRDYPFFLRLQAQELLCPLNNLRLLAAGRQCPRHQLATPEACYACVDQNRHISGSLHEAERQLAGVGQPRYYQTLRWAIAEAEAVLVVNPLNAALIEPYARAVRVVPSGFDPARFPWPWKDEPIRDRPGVTRVLFASLIGDAIKGFHVLRDACRLLWAKRRDFEVVITAERPAAVEPFERYIGWVSQEKLPSVLRSCDFLVFPTIAQEALGRTAVEAMAVGRPVIASRIGGLQFTVTDGATGLLVEPGDPADLAEKMARLIDSPQLRERLGQAGRQRFEEHFTWDTILERHYRPLLRRRQLPRPSNCVVSPENERRVLIPSLA